MTMFATAPAVITRRPIEARPVLTDRARTAPDAKTLMHWGFAVDNDGITAHEEAALVVANAATRQGLKPILIDILADRREPSVARQRAFGRLALALSR
ncbi:MAG: hypothetical protein ABI382_03570 [Nakamurella sp.]